MVIVEVTDTGSGMSPTVRERALEPFFTTKAAGQGTGLGLAMVYGMIEQAHGHIEIDSTEGKGTTIRLLFPIAKEDGPKVIRRRGAQDFVRGNGEVVLVVEDNNDLRHAMVEQLRSIGYVPIEALDCAHALKILSGDARIDVLLSDVIMASDMNGKELALQACGLRPELSVILCTGYAQAVLDQGVEPDWQVLGKPVTRRQLAQSLHLAVTGEDETQAPSAAPAA
jgi:CheY-like chemotaxis protein